MSSSSSLDVLRRPRFPLLLLQWFFIEVTVTIFNWRYFISHETALVSSATIQAHHAFSILGLIVFLFFVSVLLFWPYRFAIFMRGYGTGTDKKFKSNTSVTVTEGRNNAGGHKQQRNLGLVAATVMFVTHLLPCWIIEAGIVWECGLLTVLQGVSFSFLTVSWGVAFLAVWVAYMWHLSSVMESHHS